MTPTPDSQWLIPRPDINRLKHVVWDLIIGRILIPGVPNSDAGWPFLSLTDHGLKVVSEEHPVPYDPDGYLARLQQATGGLGHSISRYLEEALSTFRTSNYLASTVMLGAASEMLFIEICTAIAAAIRDDHEPRGSGNEPGRRRTWLSVSGQSRIGLPRNGLSFHRHGRTLSEYCLSIRSLT